MGLMIGVEAVKDRKTKEPDREFIAEVLEQARERGLVIGKGGLFGNVLRVKPRCASPRPMSTSCSPSSTSPSPPRRSKLRFLGHELQMPALGLPQYL